MLTPVTPLPRVLLNAGLSLLRFSTNFIKTRLAFMCSSRRMVALATASFSDR
jgi:hypothetical protein